MTLLLEVLLVSLFVFGLSILVGLFDRIVGFYNPYTKKIQAKNDFIYLHESRHKWQDKKGYIHLYSNVLVVSVCCTMFLQNWMFSVPAVVGILLVEGDAWIHAWINRKKNG